MGIQWTVRCSMLLYLEGSVIPLNVIMGVHWMVRWWVLVELAIWCATQSHNWNPVDGGLHWWLLVPICPSVVPSLDRWHAVLFRKLHNWIRTFLVARKYDAWLRPIIFLLQTRANISLVASTTALASTVAHLVCVPDTGPGCFSHNHTTQQHVKMYKNGR